VEKIVKLAYRESPSSEGEGPSENKRLERLERKVRGIQAHLEDKEKKDNEEFAHVNERLDKADNEIKRSALVVILPRGYPELKTDTKEERFEAQRKETVLLLLNKFDNGLDYDIKSVRHLNKGGKGRQVAEVVFGSPEQAGSIRKRFVEKVQVQDDLKDAIINLQQTPATKLRIDLIAKRLTEDLGGDSKAVVISHLPKPMLILQESGENRRAMAYVQAVRCFKDVLRSEDRKKIYERLKRIGFKGSPERSFVILEDFPDREASVAEERPAGWTRGRGKGRRGGRGRGSFASWASAVKSGLTAKRPLEQEDAQDQSSSKISKK
jgi:hypothetical protein